MAVLKKKIIIAVTLIILLILAAIYFLGRAFLSTTIRISAGPYNCGSKELAIEVNIQRNNLEGVWTFGDYEATFGDLSFKDTSYYEDIANNSFSMKHPSSLVSEGSFDSDLLKKASIASANLSGPSEADPKLADIGDGKTGLISINTDFAQEFKDFVSCFNDHSSEFYSSLISVLKTNGANHIKIIDGAYLLDEKNIPWPKAEVVD